jgi:5-methylcytosine-specific restriction endonuclease McrA
VDRASLEQWLAQGLSLDEIGRRVGRDGSTVGYWVRKHGLEAAHRERHAARGLVSRHALTAEVERGSSVGAIAEHLGVARSTVRYWLQKYGLRTVRSVERSHGRDARARGQRLLERTCRRHGVTDFILEGRGSYRCLRCRAEAVVRRRRVVKATLVQEAGGRCAICGYDRYPGALQFHHVDRDRKAFALSDQGISRSLARAREEARKCVLLCSRCHAEVEAGVVQLVAYNGADLPG